ncbi:MAG: two-component regulator propeller domain-containing protein [Agriterribacter sp.]
MRLLIVLLCWVYSVMLCAQPASPFLFRNITITDGLSQNSVISSATDATGFMWFATQDGLNRFDGKEFVVFKKSFDDVTTATHSRLGKIISYSNDELWMITTNGQLESLNLLDYSIKRVEKIPGTDFTIPGLKSILVDKKGNIWLGTEQEGVVFFERSSKRIMHFNHSSASINNMYEDAHGNIWAATQDDILFFNTNTFSQKDYYAVGKQAKISFSTIVEDRYGNMWAGSYGKGLYVKQKTDSIFLLFKGMRNFAVLSQDLVIESLLADKEGRLWMGTYGKGLLVHSIADSSTQQFLNDKSNGYSIGFNDILDIYEDRQGGIWLGTDGGGVSYYNKQLNNFNLLANANVPENVSIAPVRSITTDKNGVIWLGTSSKGITSININNKKYSSHYLLPYSNTVSNPNRVVSLLADEDDLWIGTQGNGLILLDTKTKKNIKWFYPQPKAH